MSTPKIAPDCLRSVFWYQCTKKHYSKREGHLIALQGNRGEL